MDKKKFTLFFLSAMLLTASIVCTQYLAQAMQYDPLLGRYLFKLGDKCIYPPFQCFIWMFKFNKIVPDLINQAINIFMAFFLLGSLLILIINRSKKKLTSHGTAEWADKKDIKNTGLLKNIKDDGVILGITGAKYQKNSKDMIIGVTGGKYIKDDGPTHTLVVAPTRSGKGVGIIIPTLLSWKGSTVVTDLKGENWGITAGYRQKQGNKVIKFKPTSSESASFNPLNEIRLKTVNEARDVQNICDILVDPQGTGKIEHWERTAHALLTGIIFHLKYTKDDVTLADIEAFLTDPINPFEEKVQAILSEIEAEQEGNSDFEYCHQKDTELFLKLYNCNSRYHPFVSQEFRSILNKPEKERGSVISTAESFLKLYKDPLIRRNTCKSDFKITDLMNYDNPVSLYLVFDSSDTDRLKPLFRLVITQIISRLTEKMEFENGKPVQGYKHKLLFLIDEFPALGKLELIESALAYIAGYGIKALLIAQSLNQLNKTYTDKNSIVDNCHTRVFYTPNEPVTAKYISEMLGTRTEKIENISYQDMKHLGRQTISVSEHSRALMNPDEVMKMSEEEEIILIAGKKPIRTKKVTYYIDKNFKPRLLAAPKVSDNLRED